MTDASADDPLPDEETVEQLAVRLARFAETLSERERDVFATILIRAMDPVDQMRLRSAAEVLTPREDAALRALEAQRRAHPAR